MILEDVVYDLQRDRTAFFEGAVWAWIARRTSSDFGDAGDVGLGAGRLECDLDGVVYKKW